MGTPAMSAIFDPARWWEIQRFGPTDITGHRHFGTSTSGDVGDPTTVRIASNRPEVRIAFPAAGRASRRENRPADFPPASWAS